MLIQYRRSTQTNQGETDMGNPAWTHLKPAQGKQAADYITGTVKEGNESRPFSADVVIFEDSVRFEFAGEQYHSQPQDPANATGVLVTFLRTSPPDGTYHVGQPPFDRAVILTPGDCLHFVQSGSITVLNNPKTKAVSGHMHFFAGNVEIDAQYNVSR